MNIYKQRLLNVARACRETPYPKRFTMQYVWTSDRLPGCAYGQYLARKDLWDVRPSTPHEHFNLSPIEATKLFGSAGCGNAQTPEAAARYIERFAEAEWPEAKLDPTFKQFRDTLAHETLTEETV